MRYRIGATGKERVNSLNENFKHAIHMCFPALHRYLIWSASEGKHLFGSSEEVERDWFSELNDSLNLTESQLHALKEKMSSWKSQKPEVNQLIEEIHDVKNKIAIQS